MSRMLQRLPAFLILSALLLLAAGCQEISGPVWSPDGQYIAYTTYDPPRDKHSQLSTTLFLIEANNADAQPTVLSDDGAFPRWSPEGPKLFFLGQRDKYGFFQSVLSHQPGTEYVDKPYEVALDLKGMRVVNFQLSIDGSVALLGHVRGNKWRPGDAQQITFWDVRQNKQTPLRQLGDIFSPAITPDGLTLCYAKSDPKVAEGRPYIATLELQRQTLAPKIIFPTFDYNEPNAGSYVIHAFPDGSRFLFYAPGADGIWTVKVDGTGLQKYPLPKGYTTPLMVAIAEDGQRATVTLAKVVGGRFHYDVYEMQFRRNPFKHLDGPSREVMGGHALDPLTVRRKREPRWAWLSAAGMAMGEPGKARYFPRNAEQWLAASAYYLEQGQAQMAVDAVLKARDLTPAPEDPGALDRAEARAYLALKEGGRASEAFGRAELLYPIGPEGLRFIFPPDSGLPQAERAGLDARLKEMEAYAKANPDDHLINYLRRGILARAEGKHAEAMNLYVAAEKVCPYEALTGGVKFLEAMVAFESGNMVKAGELWDNASRAKEFPQADYAAGLSAMAYVLDGHSESMAKAQHLLRRAADYGDRLDDDLRKVMTELKGRIYKQFRLSDEVKAPDGNARAWVDIKEYLIPQAYLAPTYTLTPSKSYEARRLTARIVTASGIQVAGLPGADGTRTILRVPKPITQPAFSPDSQRLAFLAEGEVFPLGEAFCEAYVINLQGAVMLGDPRAAQTGELSRRRLIKSMKWNGSSEIHVQGSNIDAFGNETLLDEKWKATRHQ